MILIIIIKIRNTDKHSINNAHSGYIHSNHTNTNNNELLINLKHRSQT